MNNDQDTIYCPRCGEPMSVNARYCMKCGNLNYNHELNQSMRKHMSKQDVTSYQVGSGKMILNGGNDEGGVRIATNTGSIILCFLFYYLLFIVIMIFSLYYILKDNSLDLITITYSFFPCVSVLVSTFFLYIFSKSLLFTKCNKPWWAAVIPIYNIFILAEITFHKKKYGIISLIPIVGIIFIFVMLYKLGKQFKYNGLITVVLPIIMIPLIGLGTSRYEGYVFTPKDGSLGVERNYKLKKIYVITMIIFILIGIGLYTYRNFSKVKYNSRILGNTYYVYASKRLVYKVKKNIEKKKIVCSDSDYIANSGVYYFYYSDLRRSGIYLPLSYLLDTIEGYVKVDNTEMMPVYYVSITDLNYGIPEVPFNDVHYDSVVEMNNLDFDTSTHNVCYFTD